MKTGTGSAPELRVATFRGPCFVKINQNLLTHRGNPAPCSSPRDTFHESFILDRNLRFFAVLVQKVEWPGSKPWGRFGEAAESLDLLTPATVCPSSFSLFLWKIRNSDSLEIFSSINSLERFINRIEILFENVIIRELLSRLIT